MTRTWWTRRSIRARVTALAVVSLAVGLLAGSVALAALFARDRVHDLDGQARAEATIIRDLVDSGQLARPLPAAAGTGLLAQVLDAGGTVLAATPSASRLLGLLPPDRLDGWPAGRITTLRDSTPGGEPLRVAVEHATLRGEPVSVVAAVPLGDVEDTLLALRRTLLVVVPIVVVAAATATWMAVGAALRPVERLRSAADAVHPTGTGALPALPVPPSRDPSRDRDEVARLAATLDQMLRRLDDAAARQRAFVADAAHELRSPLASLTTQLEVALAHPRQADWPAVAADALTDARRLARLADDLLLLARTDTPPRRAGRPVDLAALARGRGVPVTVDGDGDVVAVGDRDALDRLVGNLVDNARRHARRRVQACAARAGGQVELTVHDDGPGVPAADRQRVFERFVRLDDARSRDAGGAGLGLPIARAIARAHGGEVTVGESPLGGAAATVRLPAATGAGTDGPPWSRMSRSLHLPYTPGV